MAILSLTYAELAERLGVSIDGARMRVKRARWPKVKGNDGAMRVTVEESELAPAERSPNVSPEFGEQPNEQAAELVRTLEDHIATLKSQAALMLAHLAKAESMMEEERAKADQERERVADLTAQLNKMATDMVEWQRRPWWRRLAG